MREIVTVDSDRAGILRQRATEVGEVTKTTQTLIDDMWETMQAANGIGLAAPQVGVGLRILIVAEPELTVLDPVIAMTGGDTVVQEEGCLSIPGVTVAVSRPSRIFVYGRSRFGKKIAFSASGRAARIIQHEVDHLDGVLITDKEATTSAEAGLDSMGPA